MFQLTHQQAKDIVSQCPSCQQVNSTLTLPEGVNPRGLFPNDICQSDVTHIPTLGNAGLVHVSTDTYSGMIFASHHTGETANHRVPHFKQAFAYMGLPHIKTDNGPAHTSHTLKLFF